MNTENGNEKFFEELAHKMADSDFNSENAEEVKVDLAKASIAPSKPKITINMSENEEELSPGDEAEGQLTVDVYQTPAEIIVESAVAGVAPDDLDINVTHDSVTVKGHRHREKKIKEEDYLYQECYWGRFSRSVILPEEVDPGSARATFKNGILTVHLPKLNRQKAKKVKVKLE
ncbi:MAG: Hsp20/alpha crystallin family protein [Patescibacteria group bacterium]